MFARLIVVATVFISILSCASAEDMKKVWYQKNWDGPAIVTFRDAIREEKNFLGADHNGWSMKGDAKVCAAMKSVKLTCDYNTRINFSLFLTINSKPLFSAAGGTNPYNKEYSADDIFPDDGFVGQPKQNAMLAQAIIRNAKLFKDGDISAEAVKKSWK